MVFARPVSRRPAGAQDPRARPLLRHRRAHGPAFSDPVRRPADARQPGQSPAERPRGRAHGRADRLARPRHRRPHAVADRIAARFARPGDRLHQPPDGRSDAYLRRSHLPGSRAASSPRTRPANLTRRDRQYAAAGDASTAIAQPCSTALQPRFADVEFPSADNVVVLTAEHHLVPAAILAIGQTGVAHRRHRHRETDARRRVPADCARRHVTRLARAHQGRPTAGDVHHRPVGGSHRRPAVLVADDRGRLRIRDQVLLDVS